MAAETCCGFHSHRVLPWRAHRFTVWSIQPHLIQAAANVSFEIAHDPLRRYFRFYHRVHVIAPHVSRQQAPATMHTHFLNRFPTRRCP